MKKIIEYLKKVWNIFVAAREASAIAEASRYISNTQHLQELQERQRKLMLINFYAAQR